MRQDGPSRVIFDSICYLLIAVIAVTMMPLGVHLGLVKAKVTRQAEGKTAGNQINQTSIPFDGVPVDGPLNDPVNSSGVQRVPGPLSKSFSHAGASSLPVSYRLVNEDDAEFYEELDPSTLLAQAIVDADITSPEEDDTARDTVDVNGTAAGSWFSDFILKIKARGLLFGCHFDGDLTEFNGGPGWLLGYYVPPGYTTGKFGQGVHLGSVQYADYNSYVDNEKGTFEAWVVPDWGGADTNMHVIHRGYYSQSPFYGTEVYYENGVVRFNMAASDGTRYCEKNVNGGNSDIQAGVPFHIAATWENGTLHLYINGMPEDETGGSGSGIPAGDMSRIILACDHPADNHPLDGVMDEAVFLNYARTPQDILRDANAASPRENSVVINQSSTPVANGLLGSVDTTAFKDDDYSLFLRVNGWWWTVNEDSVGVIVDNQDPTAAIDSPEEDGIVGSSPVSITGSAWDETFDNYWLEYGEGEDPSSWNPLGSSHDQPVYSGELESWDISSLDDGAYTVKLHVEGDGTESVVTRHINIDSGLPTAEIISPEEDDFVGDSEVITGTADDTTFTGYTLHYCEGHHEDGGPGGWQEITSSTTPVVEGDLGTWDTTSLSDGDYTIKLSVTDALENVSDDFVFAKLDRTDPQAAITEPLSQAVVELNQTIRGTATDANFDFYELYYASGWGTHSPEDWTQIGNTHNDPVENDELDTWDTSSLTEGDYTLLLRVADLSGRESTAEVQVSVLVIEDPTALITAPVSGSYLSGTVNITGVAFGESFGFYSVYYSATGANDWQPIVENITTPVPEEGTLCQWDTTAVTDGGYDISLLVENTVGAQAVHQISGVHVDNTDPQAEITNPGEGDIVDETCSIIGTATDANLGTYKVEYGYGEEPSEWTLIGEVHSTSVQSNVLEEFNIESLESGPYGIRLTVTDKANNTKTASVNIIVLVMGITIISVTPDSAASGNSNVSVELIGNGFAADAYVMFGIMGGEDAIEASNVNVSQDGTQLSCTLDLTGVNPGLYSAVVQNPDEQFGILWDCFTITPPDPPTISSITPDNAVAGNDNISISDLIGTNFISGATVRLTKDGENDIYAFDVNITSPTKIECTLDLIDAVAGDWNVVVTNPDGQNAVLTDGFTVNPLPVISSITPASAPSGDNSVSISELAGSDFATGAVVKLTKDGQDDIEASDVDVVSSTNITCAFDLSSTVSGEWNIEVTNPDGGKGKLIHGFTINGPLPTIASITPDNAATGNDNVSITEIVGNNFTAGAEVKLTKDGEADIKAVNVDILSSTKITCIFDLTGASLGDWNLVIINPDGGSATLDEGFTINSAPTIESITPESAPTGDSDVAITELTGTNFKPGANIKLRKCGQAEGEPVEISATSVNVVSSTCITCKLDLSDAMTGVWDIMLINQDGGIAELLEGFAVNGPVPTVDAITPDSARSGNDSVSITELAGTNFVAGATVKFVRAGEDDIETFDVDVVSLNTIACKMDLDGAAAGTWNVVVSNPDGESGILEDGFMVKTAPSITSITPASAESGNNNLSITELEGTSFVSGATVKLMKYDQIQGEQIEINATDVTVDPSTSISCKFDLSGTAPGFWNVVVTNPDEGHGELEDGFLITSTPDVTSITPGEAASGRNNVSITEIAGDNFMYGVSVRLTRSGEDDIGATDVTVDSSTSISCKFDLSGTSLGAWNVIITNPDGGSEMLENGFEVTEAPSVTSITPNEVETGSNNVSITEIAGDNFMYGASVRLTRSGEDDIGATDVTVDSSTSISCKFDLSGTAPGFWNVVVTNPDEGHGELEDGFEITEASSALPEVSITSPVVDGGAGETCQVIGTASGANFSEYELFYKTGTDPASPEAWQQIGESQENSIEDGLLGTWDTTSLEEGSYLLKLVVYGLPDTSNALIMPIKVDHTLPLALISEPQASQTGTGLVKVVGTASDDNLSTYILEYASAGNPGIWNQIDQYQSDSINEDLLGWWNTGGLTDGEYSLRLTAVDKAGNSASCIVSLVLNNSTYTLTGIRTEPQEGIVLTVGEAIDAITVGTDTVGIDHLVPAAYEAFGSVCTIDPSGHLVATNLGSGHVTATYSVFSYDMSVSVVDKLESRILSGDTTWTQAQSPIVIDGWIVVPVDVSLTIEPGTVIKFVSGGIYVEGSLTASGALLTSIYDDSESTSSGGSIMPIQHIPFAGDWSAVYLAQGSTGSLGGTEFRYGGKKTDETIIGNRHVECNSELYSMKDQLSVNGCTFLRSESSGIISESAIGPVSFTNNTIENCGEVGIIANPCFNGVDISSNTISGCGIGVEAAVTGWTILPDNFNNIMPPQASSRPGGTFVISNNNISADLSFVDVPGADYPNVHSICVLCSSDTSYEIEGNTLGAGINSGAAQNADSVLASGITILDYNCDSPLSVQNNLVNVEIGELAAQGTQGVLAEGLTVMSAALDGFNGGGRAIEVNNGLDPFPHTPQFETLAEANVFSAS